MLKKIKKDITKIEKQWEIAVEARLLIIEAESRVCEFLYVANANKIY